MGISYKQQAIIQIRSNNGRILVNTSIEKIIAGFAALIFLICELNSNNIIYDWIDSMYTNTSDESLEWGNKTIKIIHYTSILISFIASSVFILWDIIKTTYRVLWHMFLHRPGFRQFNFYYWKKFKSDLKNSSISSASKMVESMRLTVAEVQEFELQRKTNDNWITNKSTWPIPLTCFEDPISDSVLECLRLNHAELQSSYKKEISNLKNWKISMQKSDYSIDFRVAAVNPIFFQIAKDIQDEIGLSENIEKRRSDQVFNVSAETQTGPETMSESMRFAQVPTIGERNKIPLFVVPISAYITSEYENGGNILNPNTFFSPIVPIATEKQSIVYVESSESIPKGKRNLYFLNNSTAEECAANLSNDLDTIFNPVSIDSYVDYLKLIQGKRTNFGELSSGDAIVLWSPLTRYFLNNSTGSEGYLKKLRINDSNVEFFSRLGLFGLNPKTNSLPNNVLEYYRSIIKAFVLKMAIQNYRISIGSKRYLWQLLYRFKTYTHYIKNFRKAFKGIFTGN